MSGWEAVGINAVSGAGQLAIQKYLESRKGRERIQQLFSSLPRSSRRAAETWLEDPVVGRLLTAGGDEFLSAAELRLRDAISAAGHDAPERLRPIVTAASHLLVEQMPATPEIRRVRDELKKDIEDAQTATENAMRQALAEERQSVRRTALVAGVHPRVRGLLEKAHDTASASKALELIAARPTRAGVLQLADRLTACDDPAVWEALAHYAAFRHWNTEASGLAERAAGVSAAPERLLVWSAWFAHSDDDPDRVEELMARARSGDDGAVLLRAASSFFREESFTEADALEFSTHDDFLVGVICLDSMLKSNDLQAAEELVQRWRSQSDSTTSRTMAAQVHWARALQSYGPERLRQHQAALELATDAWEELHSYGLPAPNPARVAVLVGTALQRLHVVREIAGVGNPHRAEELADPDVAAHAQLAMEILQEEGVQEHLSEFDRRVFDIMGPAALLDDAVHPSLEQLQQLSALATTSQQRARALLMMANAGHRDEAALGRLRTEDPTGASIVEAAYLSATGNHAAAAARLRPIALQHAGAGTQLVRAYELANQPMDAADAALAVWERHGDPMFLTHAAHLLAEEQEAPEPLVERLRNGLIEAQARLDDVDRISTLLEALVVIHINRVEYHRAASFAGALHDLTPGDHSRWRVALTQTLLGNYRAAWEALTTGGSIPRPRSDEELRLLSVLVDAEAQDSAPAVELLGLAQRANDSEVEASAILVCQRVALRVNDEGLSRDVAEALHGFVTSHPDSETIRALPFDEADPLAAFRPNLTELTNAHREFERLRLIGRIPFLWGAIVARRSPAELLAARDDYPLFAAAQTLITRQRERAVAEAALGSAVSVDITTLHVLAELRAAGCQEIAAFVDAFLATPIAHDVAAHANDPVGEIVVYPTFDSSRPGIVRLTADDQRRRERRQRLMREVSDELGRHVLTGELTVFERDDIGNEEYVVCAAAEAAIRRRVPLWADDAAMREMMREAGVASFGTRDLLDALKTKGLIDAEAHQAARAALRKAGVTDLPSTIKEVLARVRAGAVEPTDTAAIRLPGWWAMYGNTVLDRWTALVAALVDEDPGAVPSWFANACVGLALNGGGDKPAVLLLLLVLEVPALRQHVDDLVAAANSLLWCVPTTISAEHLWTAAELIAEQADSADPGEVLEMALGESRIGAEVAIPRDDVQPAADAPGSRKDRRRRRH